MSKKILTLKDPEFRRLAKEKNKLWLELENSRAVKNSPDYSVQDQWGTYVSLEQVEKLLEVMEEMAGVDNKDESRAIRYSRAGLLLSLNRLDDAEREFKLLVTENPEQPERNKELAVIAARRGNLEEAMRLAAIVNEVSQKTFIHISKGLLDEEYERYKRVRSAPSTSF